MVLIVFFSSRISPLASAVIFLLRSPEAIAVETSAMLRTWPVRLLAIRLTLSVRSFQVPSTPGTSAWPPSLPSVPTSRATRVTSEAKAFSWSTMTLIVFFSSSVSPRTSTVTLRLRSPRAIAVATSAMLRTWVVRLPAMKFTLSVRSFQVPATPLTSAWPPSLPSVPTSRATRVTSEANELSWSTMVLMVSFSARISPRASTVIFLLRSPLAIAVATSAMPRTWPVRFEAMKFTLSVRSRQVPATPLTSAWPPSLPSVPTSRATRVTSEANELSWSTMVLIVFFSSRISPRASAVIFLLRSPRAIAVETSAMLRTWPVRFEAIRLTLSVRSRQVPLTPCTSAWPPSLPSVPTSRATRITSEANELSWPTMVLTIEAVRKKSPWSGRPSISSGTVCERSPRATALMTRMTSVVGWARLVISALTAPMLASQPPPALPRLARWVRRPSVPTTVLIRSNSRLVRSFSSMISFSVSAILPARPT